MTTWLISTKRLGCDPSQRARVIGEKSIL